MDGRTSQPRSPARRAARLALVAALGIALGVGVYLGYGIVTAPGPADAPGWERIAEMPEPRGETAVATTGSRLYVIGGLAGLDFHASATVSILDAGTEAWSAGPPLPEPRHHAAAAAIGSSVYISGGASSLGDGAPRPDVWVLTGESGAWQPVAPMPVGRFGHRMVALEGLLYVVGGVSGAGAGTGGEAVDPGAVLIYDPIADAWTAGAPIPTIRDHLAVVEVDGEIWAIGGRAGGRNHADVDIYDAAADSWRPGPPLPEATSGASEGVVGGRILLSGGEDPGGGVIVDRHWFIDARAFNAAAWFPLDPPPLTVHGVPGAVLNGRFVIAGGSARPGGQSNTAWTGLTQVLVEAPSTP